LEEKTMKAINTIALILVIIGAINWGLWGFFQFDFVAWLLGGHSTTGSRIAYGVIGPSDTAAKRAVQPTPLLQAAASNLIQAILSAVQTG
jgi:uncharacterized membrane protein YuzA (DUF378 family)